MVVAVWCLAGLGRWALLGRVGVVAWLGWVVGLAGLCARAGLGGGLAGLCDWLGWLAGWLY